MRSRIPKVLVGLTALTCLGVGGYAGQVWWARRMAARVTDPKDLGHRRVLGQCRLGHYFSTWRECPTWGRWSETFDYYKSNDGSSYFLKLGHRCWIPRRTYWEALRIVFGQDFGDDPDLWEAWFESHSHHIWSEKRKQWVEAPKP